MTERNKTTNKKKKTVKQYNVLEQYIELCIWEYKKQGGLYYSATEYSSWN